MYSVLCGNNGILQYGPFLTRKEALDSIRTKVDLDEPVYLIDGNHRLQSIGEADLIDTDECSWIYSFRKTLSETQLAELDSHLEHLPVRRVSRDTAHQWLYNGSCDGNTTLALEEIIKNTVRVFFH